MRLAHYSLWHPVIEPNEATRILMPTEILIAYTITENYVG